MTQKVKLKITGMHCTNCAFNIDGQLEDTEGVKEAKTNYAKQESIITYDPSKVSVNQMITSINKLDNSYNAELIN